VFYFSSGTPGSDINYPDIQTSYPVDNGKLQFTDLPSFLQDPQLSKDCQYIYVEGADASFPSLMSASNVALLQNWVNDGGKLFINTASSAAYSGSTPVYVGFDVSITPIPPKVTTLSSFDTTFFPFSLSGVSVGVVGLVADDPRLTSIMKIAEGSILSYMFYGKGVVFFGASSEVTEDALFRQYTHCYIPRKFSS
jgi:hypothetical protein